MRITIYHSVLYLLVNLWNVQSFSRISTKIANSRTQLQAIDPIVEAYQKKAAVPDITANIVVPSTPSPDAISSVTSNVPPVTSISPPTPNINVPEVKDLDELASYLEKSVDSAKVAAAQAASAASDIMKQQTPAIDDGKVYNMFEYLKTLNRQDNAGVGFTVNQERVDTLMNNFMGYKNTVISETDKVASSSQGTALAVHLQEYFPWYVAAFAVLYSVNTRNSVRAEMKKQYQEELETYKAKAEEAASAALQAAEGAKSVKDAVLVSGTESAKHVSSTVSKLQELQEDKENTKKEIAKLIKDLQSLQEKFDIVLAEKEALEVKVSAPAPAMMDTTTPLVDEALFSDEKKEKVTPKKVKSVQKSKAGIEDVKILEVLKEMDDEKSLKSGKGIMEMEAEKKAATKAKSTTKKAKSSKSAKSSKVSKAATKEKEEKKPVAEKEKPAPKKTTKRRKSTKVKESIIVESDEPIIVVQEEKIEESTEKIVKHPWSKLSPSTLSRKTVKELSSFLEERGAAYADDKGKPFMKKILVSSVQEYL